MGGERPFAGAKGVTARPGLRYGAPEALGMRSLQLACTSSLGWGRGRGGLKRPAHGKYRRRGKGGQQREGGGRGKGRRPRHEGRGLSGVRECRRPCVRGGTGGEGDAAMHAYGPGGGDFELKDVQSSSKSQEDASCMRRGCTYPGVLKQADPLAACTGKTRAVPPAASKRASKTME